MSSFFEFLPVMDTTSDLIASVLLDRLNSLFSQGDREKPSVQAYDGANVMRGEWAGVQQKVCAHFNNAYYVHCYAYQLNLIMHQATSHIPAVRVFFSDLWGIATFFFTNTKTR